MHCKYFTVIIKAFYCGVALDGQRSSSMKWRGGVGEGERGKKLEIAFRILKKFTKVCLGVNLTISWTYRLLKYLASLSPFGISKMILVSFAHLKKISNFLKLQGCGSKNELATPFQNLI